MKGDDVFVSHKALTIGLNDRSRYFLVNFLENILGISVDTQLRSSYDIFSDYDIVFLPVSNVIFFPKKDIQTPIVFVNENLQPVFSKYPVINLEPFDQNKIRQKVFEILKIKC